MNFWSLQFLKAQWDTLIVLIFAVVVTALSLFDKIDEADVSKWTLAVLALLCFTIVKDRQTRTKDAAEATAIKKTLAALDGRLSAASEIEAVAPDAIGRWFADAWSTTTRWRFKGGTGTYLRAQTLPGLGLNKQRTAEVWAEILAPDDEKVCDKYGRHRRRGPKAPTDDGGTERWTTEEVRIQSYATIVAAIWYSEHWGVRVRVALAETMSSIRQDMSDDFVLVTNEFPNSRALAIVRKVGGGFFESSRRELEISFDEARQLDLTGLSLPRNKISGDDVLRVLNAVGGLKDDAGFLTGAVCTQIALKAISMEHATSLGVAEGGAEDPYPMGRR